MIYLDYNATAPLRPQVQALMAEILAMPANPSSAHRAGREAKRKLENARAGLAGCISAFPNEIIFTGSATEANSWVLRAFAPRVLASGVEHSSVLNNVAAPPIPVDGQGVVDLAALQALLTQHAPALVSVMLANNETGVIQPIRDIAALCRAHGALLHCDAVQGLGKIPIDFSLLEVDFLTICAHKCGGPVGAGALVVKTGRELAPLHLGGGQELKRRAGTENVAAIAGFALACELSIELSPLRGWLDAMEQELAALGAVVYGAGALRLPNTSCLSLPGVSNEVQLMHHDLAGIALSAGSACSSGRIEPSHVLAAMGVGEQEARTALRVSGGWGTAREDIAAFAESWKALRVRLKAPVSP